MSEKKHKEQRRLEREEERFALAAAETTKRRSRVLTFLENYGMNLGGVVLTLGALFQLGAGALTGATHKIVSSVAFLAATSLMAADWKNLGLKPACVLGSIGHGAALLPRLLAGDLKTIAVFSGIVALNASGSFNTQLEKKFGHLQYDPARPTQGHRIMDVLYDVVQQKLGHRTMGVLYAVGRQTLGYPHRIIGFGMVLASYLPAIALGYYYGETLQANFYEIFTVGGILVGFSQPKPEGAHPAKARPKKIIRPHSGRDAIGVIGSDKLYTIPPIKNARFKNRSMPRIPQRWHHTAPCHVPRFP